MTFHIFWTLALIIIFIGIYLWAWSKNRTADFKEASMLPLEDNAPSNNTNIKENNHG